jgi:hypothetical protein
MHVGIADQRIEGQTPDKLPNIDIITFNSNDAGNIEDTRLFVFVLRLDPEYLRKVFHMDSAPITEAIKALDGERLTRHRCNIFGQAHD